MVSIVSGVVDPPFGRSQAVRGRITSPGRSTRSAITTFAALSACLVIAVSPAAIGLEVIRSIGAVPPEIGGRCIEVPLIGTCDDDGGTLGEERASGGQANATRAAGDESNFVCK